MEDHKNRLEQSLVEALFSDKFRNRTASFTLPPFAAGAAGVAAGCVGFYAYGNIACDPMFYQHHPKHIEIAVSTSTAPVSLSNSFAVVLPRST
jgi:hypothetical protein